MPVYNIKTSCLFLIYVLSKITIFVFQFHYKIYLTGKSVLAEYTGITDVMVYRVLKIELQVFYSVKLHGVCYEIFLYILSFPENR